MGLALFCHLVNANRTDLKRLISTHHIKFTPVSTKGKARQTRKTVCWPCCGSHSDGNCWHCCHQLYLSAQYKGKPVNQNTSVLLRTTWWQKKKKKIRGETMNMRNLYSHKWPLFIYRGFCDCDTKGIRNMKYHLKLNAHSLHPT